jgi:hypothetical protein
MKSDAILQAYCPGECRKQAIAGILSGENIQSGRLPVAICDNIGYLPDFQVLIPGEKDLQSL